MAVRVKERPIRQYDDHVARLNFPGSMEGQKSPTDKFAKECRRQKAVPLVAIYAARNQDGGHFFGCEADIENLMLVGSDVDNLADNLAAYLLCAVCGRRDLAHDLIDMVYEAQNRNAVENGYEGTLEEWLKSERVTVTLQGKTFEFSTVNARKMADAIKTIFEAMGGTVS